MGCCSSNLINKSDEISTINKGKKVLETQPKVATEDCEI